MMKKLAVHNRAKAESITRVEAQFEVKQNDPSLVGEVSANLTVVGRLDSALARVTVVKRNGLIVPFRLERVINAISGAFREVHSVPTSAPLPQDIHTAVLKVADLVVATIKNRFSEESGSTRKNSASITVEEIQDIVERKLMELSYYDVARSYILYRDHHKTLRDDSPENLKVIRRDGKTVVRFNPMKIGAAVEAAFLNSEQAGDFPVERVVSAVNLITNKVVSRCVDVADDQRTIGVETIQDEIEKELMDEKFFAVAKRFILYRSKRAELREHAVLTQAITSEGQNSQVEGSNKVEASDVKAQGRIFNATAKDGTTTHITESLLRSRIKHACRDFENSVSSEEVLEDSIRNFYEGIREEEVDTSNIMAARAKIELDPAYSYVAARLLLDALYREAIGCSADDINLSTLHKRGFAEAIRFGISHERLSPNLKDFDLDALADAIVLERDLKFQYLGLQTLYDRYLLHEKERRFETPQYFWMRVAMGLSLNEGEDRNIRAIQFYNILSQFQFVSSTPTLFNSGTLHSQMSSCYLSTVMDDLHHIFKSISDDAQLSKWAGGLGNDWTNVRATGAWIKGTNGRSQGVIPFLKVANDTAVAVNQGGKRKGAMCAYLETWHLDIEDFLELRKNTGDERRRTHDMNTANWIPDLFMKRVQENGSWTLFNPSDVPDLHDLYGKSFEEKYICYEKMADEGTIKLFKRIEAIQLWRKMLSMLFETGHPWITFKDPSNIRSPQDHTGVVHSSNLCTEILLNTSNDEVAVCNLGSINLVEFVSEDGIDEKLLSSCVQTAIRMLDNVIDLNFYPIEEAKNANLRHRPVGLGLMGFQDALYVQNIPYSSPEAVEFADKSMEMISYYAILGSTELARERGSYPTYKGSKWDRGLLPIDTLDLLIEDRGGEWLEVSTTTTLDWDKVREAVRLYGMRNSNTMAIAPTATISNITGVTQSIEPMYKHLFSKSNLSGEFLVHNDHLVRELKRLGIWDLEMIDDLKYFDGSIQEIDRIPDHVKRLYQCAFEIEPEWLIECASRRQKWIDMGQSLNLYIAEPNGKKLNDMYFLAWRRGLKTTYYLRSLGATQIEKSTTDINRRGLQPRWMKNKSASSNVTVERNEVASTTYLMTEGKSCNLDGECESCQ
jgi:ribonucleoside-diphosphate reductase alpha chain